MSLSPSEERELLRLLEIERKREGNRSTPSLPLTEFIRNAWHVLEPSTPFIDNWHIQAISRHLEAVRAGEIRRLLINVPPGHMKSLITSVFWPAWMWVDQPGWRMLSGSYAGDLAIRDAVKTRYLIESDWFQTTFRPTWTLSTDQNVKSYYQNTARGERVAISVGGRTTGFRGNAVVVDDPLGVMDAYSTTKREEATRWLDQAATNRLSDMRTGVIVIIMQRLHQDDPAGHVLRAGGYEHLCLPSEFEPERKCVTSIGWEDPRTELGELLFPAMFPTPVIAQERKRLGHAYSGQHQQRPTDAGGAMFKREWFEIVPVAPARLERRVRRWDKAATEGGGDWTAGVLMGCRKGVYYVIDVQRFQHEDGKRDSLMRQAAMLDGPDVDVVGPQDPGSAGKTDAAHFIKLMAGFDVSTEIETGSKETRARALAAQCYAGNVKLVAGQWNEAFIDEYINFPRGSHDDQVDAGAGAFNYLALKPPKYAGPYVRTLERDVPEDEDGQGPGDPR